MPRSRVFAGEGGVEGSVAVVKAVMKLRFRWTASYKANKNESFDLKNKYNDQMLNPLGIIIYHYIVQMI